MQKSEMINIETRFTLHHIIALMHVSFIILVQ